MTPHLEHANAKSVPNGVHTGTLLDFEHNTVMCLTSDGTLIHNSLKEALLVNTPPINPLLNSAFVQKAVDKGLSLLAISENPSNCLQHFPSKFPSKPRHTTQHSTVVIKQLYARHPPHAMIASAAVVVANAGHSNLQCNACNV